MPEDSKHNPPAPIRADLLAEWMLDERITFLNHGSFGAVPRCVFDEQMEWRRRIEAEPIELLGRQCPELIATAKRPVAALLHMREADFGLVTNATEGVNSVLRSLVLTPQDELLTTTHVYNAVRMAMRAVAERAEATCREIDVSPTSSSDILAAVVGAFSSRTKLLVIDHVTSPTAIIFPVKAIIEAARERGIDVLVDGAHAPGMLDLNVTDLGAAYYTGNLHKWVCGPKGSGFIWVRRDLQPQVHPPTISHFFGSSLAVEFAWQGTRDISGWLTVPAAIEFMSSLGWDRVRRYNHEMAVWAQRMLCERWKVQPLSPMDGSLLGSMVTVPLPGSLASLSIEQSDRLQQLLYKEHKVEVPVVRWGERIFVRPCCQVYNRAADYERLADVIEKLAM